MKQALIPADRDPDTIDDEEIHRLIFSEGFSTAKQLSDVSGRGIGMNVVKSAIEKLRGSIRLRSEYGVGTEFLISLPLTTAITDGMQFSLAGGSTFFPSAKSGNWSA